MKKVTSVSLIIFIEIMLAIYLLFFYKTLHIKLIGNNSQTISVNSNYKDEGVASCYGTAFKCKYIKPIIKSNINSDKIGNYEISYTVSVKNNKKTVKRKIKVIDTIKPIINFKSIPKVCKNGYISEENYDVYDNYDKNVKIDKKIENEKIIYTVTDSSQNKIIKEIAAEIIDDKISPVITLKGNLYEYVQVGSEYKEPGYTAYDNCMGDVTDKVAIDGSVDTSKSGIYVISYSVKDDSGNKTTIKRYVKVYKKYKGETITPAGKTIYLTFDDGPSSYTNEILNILKEYDIKATFFVVNTGNDSILKREVNEGHTVALHSYTHNYRTVYSSTDAYFLDLELIRNKVKSVTGVDTNIIRFPGGSSNTVSKSYCPKIMSSLVNDVQNRGYKYVDWNIDSGDVTATSSAQIINNIKKSLKGNATNVILMHDTKIYTKNALREIIDYGISNGYNFLPITESTPDVHHGVNN